MRRGRLSGGSLISVTVAIVPTATELSGWGASDINGSCLGEDRLHQNGFGQFFAQGETGIADQADDIGFAAQEFDALLLTQAEFAQAVAQFGLGEEQRIKLLS